LFALNHRTGEIRPPERLIEGVTFVSEARDLVAGGSQAAAIRLGHR